MAELFTLPNLFTLLMLVLLQAVLGFDNLLYISMESKKVEPEKQQYVRRVGVIMAIFLRIALLFILVKAIESFQTPFFETHMKWLSIDINVHAVIVLFGGGFIVYTAIKEIFHMLSGDIAHEGEAGGKQSVGKAIFWIVVMNLIFSFDSILSAIALTKVFAVMATAIVISGVLMVWLADTVSVFLQKNRMYEVLGLFILFLVGIMLLSEGAHLAHLKLFGHEIHPMAKSTFYFVIAVMVVIDLVQGGYQKRLTAAQDKAQKSASKEGAPLAVDAGVKEKA